MAFLILPERLAPCASLLILLLSVESCSAFAPKASQFVSQSSTSTALQSSYLDSLSSNSQSNGADASTSSPSSTSSMGDSFTVGILGDLHMDPRKLEDYQTGRDQVYPILQQAQQVCGKDNVALVSLGDLGESKSIRPQETSELFAGTTECHELAADFLGSFNVPYEVIGGNHDLEGLDEFDTDQANLDAFLRIHGKPHPQFCRQIADKTLLVGLGSTLFRDAQYTSHEVVIDAEQMQWFEDTLKAHPSSDGWKIFVFTHAPPNGSGLRVLQENHVVNGCCWLNHSDDSACRKFIELVREHRSIKAWFSGHFHLGQDYQDSITFPTVDPKEGPYPNRGSCVFAQTSVMRAGTSRDGRQQSRLLRGNKDGFEICTIDHANGGSIRLDATITYTDNNHEVGVYAHADVTRQNDPAYFKVYAPCAGDALHPPDENYIPYGEDGRLHVNEEVTPETVAWWRMSCGRVLGMLNGMLIEYDKSTLAPLGLVVGADELVGKRVAVVDSGLPEECVISEEVGMEGAECADVWNEREQSVILYDTVAQNVVVIQPNEDGSYWRKIVRNKMIREKEKRRLKAAKEFAELELGMPVSEGEANVVSTWGPYTSFVGNAKKTGVVGVTVPAAR